MSFARPKVVRSQRPTIEPLRFTGRHWHAIQTLSRPLRRSRGSRLTLLWFLYPLAPAELDEVNWLIDHALALAPNSPEAHLALGLFFYFVHRQ